MDDQKIFLIVGEKGSNEGTLFHACVNEVLQSIDSLIPRRIYMANYSITGTIRKMASMTGWENDDSDAGIEYIHELKIASQKYNGFLLEKLNQDVMANVRDGVPYAHFVNCINYTDLLIIREMFYKSGFKNILNIMFLSKPKCGSFPDLKNYDNTVVHYDRESFQHEALRFCMVYDLYDFNSQYLSKIKKGKS